MPHLQTLPPLREPEVRLYCICGDNPRDTVQILRAAAARHGLRFIEVEADEFDYEPSSRARPGDLIYRPGITTATFRTEQFLCGPGVATFYRDTERMFLDHRTSLLVFERQGLPVPATRYCSTSSREMLRKYAAAVGGFPLLLKASGYSGGLGVIYIDSFPALFSTIDFMLEQGCSPLIQAFIPAATHWRAIVVGQEVVASYPNPIEEDDVRSYATENRAEYGLPLPPGAAELAVKAVQSLHLEFGGVDILQDTDGSLWLLEANFPCYFVNAEQEGGRPVSDAMVSYLLEKAARLRS